MVHLAYAPLYAGSSTRGVHFTIPSQQTNGITLHLLGKVPKFTISSEWHYSQSPIWVWILLLTIWGHGYRRLIQPWIYPARE